MGGDTIAMSTRCTRPFAFTNVPSLPRERRDGEDDVGGVRQRVPHAGVDDENARLAQNGDERGVVALLAEVGVGDVENCGRRRREDEDFLERRESREAEPSPAFAALEAGRLGAAASSGAASVP